MTIPGSCHFQTIELTKMNKTILTITILLITKTAFAGETRCRDLIYPLCPDQESISLWKPTEKSSQVDCYCDQILQQPAYGTVSCVGLDGNVDDLYQYDTNTTCATEDTFTVIECCILITGPVCDTIEYIVHISTDCETPSDLFCCVPNNQNPMIWNVLSNDQDFILQNYPNHTLQSLEIQNITSPPLFGSASIIQSFSIEYTLGQPGFMGIDSLSYDVFYELISPMNDTITICDEQTAYFLIEDCLDTSPDEFSLLAGDTIYFNPLDNDLIMPTLSLLYPDSLDCQNPLPQLNASSLVLQDTGDIEIINGPLGEIWCFASTNGGDFSYNYEICTTDSICNTDSIIIHVAETCDSNLNISGSISSGTYFADFLILSAGIIDDVPVDFKAGTQIFLDSGFQSGIDFSANIEDCDCTITDRAALEALYFSTNGLDWNNTWDLATPIDTWYGVTLNENDCISQLDLSYNNLDGTIPPELGNLTQLQFLYLNNNQLQDSIPLELGALPLLRVMALNDNQLTGNIPAALGNLAELRYMRLSNNQLTGNIPVQLGNLSKLINLLLYDNQLNGTIPAALANLADLEYLRLYNNQLSACYNASLLTLCSQLNPASNTNSSISNGNSFDADWESFCSSGAGMCM